MLVSKHTITHIKLPCIAISSIQLDIFTLSSSHSLFISLTFLLILGQNHYKTLFKVLVNFRSTYYFANSKFMNIHNLKT